MVKEGIELESSTGTSLMEGALTPQAPICCLSNVNGERKKVGSKGCKLGTLSKVKRDARGTVKNLGCYPSQFRPA